MPEKTETIHFEKPSEGPTPTDIQRRFFSFSNRMLMLERDVETIRNHIQLLERDIIDKHREALKQIKSVESEISDIKTEISELKDFISRIEDRLSAFASKDTVSVLEKYINFWEPLKYVTRKEVEDLIAEKLSKRTKRLKKK